MRAVEKAVTQRGLAGRRLALADREIPTKYIFPFVDAGWTVPFVVLDIFGGGAMTLMGPIASREEVLRSDRTSADLRPLTSLPLDAFRKLVHFDPWWAFRGIGGLDLGRIDAIIASNVARPFDRDRVPYKVHDLEFADDLARLESFVAKDPSFRPRRFRSGEIDLLALRRPAKTL